MPRYFFDIDDGGMTHDNDGQILNNGAEIRAAVVKRLLILRSEKQIGVFAHPIIIVVRNEAGRNICRGSVEVMAPRTGKLQS